MPGHGVKREMEDDLVVGGIIILFQLLVEFGMGDCPVEQGFEFMAFVTSSQW